MDFTCVVLLNLFETIDDDPDEYVSWQSLHVRLSVPVSYGMLTAANASATSSSARLHTRKFSIMSSAFAKAARIPRVQSKLYRKDA